MNIITPTSLNGRGITTGSWLSLSVREFFTSVNWENRPPEVRELTQELVISGTQGIPSSLSLSLTVSQFFGAIPWDGVAIAPMPIQESEALPPVSTGEGDFTLEGFSDLFG